MSDIARREVVFHVMPWLLVVILVVWRFDDSRSQSKTEKWQGAVQAYIVDQSPDRFTMTNFREWRQAMEIANPEMKFPDVVFTAPPHTEPVLPKHQ